MYYDGKGLLVVVMFKIVKNDFKGNNMLCVIKKFNQLMNLQGGIILIMGGYSYFFNF